MTALVVQANAACLPLPDSTVDLVVTSPPYFALRSYQDGGRHYDGQVGSEPTPAEFIDALVAVTAECVRVLKPSGSIWVNLGDKYGGSAPGRRDAESRNELGRKLGRNPTVYNDAGGAPPGWKPPEGTRPKSLIGLPWRYALRCIDDLGLILRAEVIWSKPNGLPESVTDRVRRSHETWFHFTAQPRYFSAVDEVREPYLFPNQSRTMGDSANGGKASGPVHKRQDGAANPLGKLPGSVWTVPTQPLRVPEHLGVDHFAAFPFEFPRRIIKGWSPAGGVILDPFGGTGTTALVASALGRTGISVDLSHDYSRLAQWRTTDPAQRAKAAQQPKPKTPPKAPDPEQHPDQLDIFGEDVA